MSVVTDKESRQPPSQETSPDTAFLDFLSVIAGKSLPEKRSVG